MEFDNKNNTVENYKRCFVENTGNFEHISASFSFNGEYYVSSCSDNTYHIRSVHDPKTSSVLKSPNFGSGIVVHSHHEKVILSSFSNRGYMNSVGLLSLENKEFFQFFHAHTDEIISLDHNNASDTFLTSGCDKTTILWDERSNNPCFSRCISNGTVVSCFDGSGTQIIEVQPDCASYFDLRTFPYQVNKAIRIEQNVYRKVTSSLDGKYLACSATDGTICLIKHTETIPEILYIKTDSIGDSPSIEFTPDSSRLIYANGYNGSLSIYELETKQTHDFTTCHETVIRSIKCNKKYPILATTCSNIHWWTPLN
ncbi:WD repeat-containing protein 82-B [Entamoeba marina]